MQKILAFFLLAIVFSGCINQSQNHDSDSMDKEEAVNIIDFNPNEYKEEDIVFYNLFSPVDFTYLVTKDLSFYNSSLLNPLNNITNYNESYKAALNLGVYGADLSYLWLFDQQQQAHSYLTAIQQLSNQLTIPREFVDFTYAKVQDQSNELDTLISIARESYYTAEEYLKETGRDYAASLILLGGWIETLYIAVNMYDDPDPKIVSKIATQKFSSNSLYKLLKSSQNNENLAEYLLLIKKMNKLFEDLNIQYPEGSLVIDTSGHKIFVAEDVNIILSEADIKEIRELTTQIRTYIVE